MKERVKQLRTEYLHLSQTEFGARIGVKKSAIYHIEKGVNNLTKQMILAICSEYKVNQAWLESGTGPVFLDDYGSDELSSAVIMASKDPVIRKFVKEYSKIDYSTRLKIQEFWKRVLIEGDE